ncbi:hypothetical protein BDV10DRAFT_162088 [Aspergillus recurvatus]
MLISLPLAIRPRYLTRCGNSSRLQGRKYRIVMSGYTVIISAAVNSSPACHLLSSNLSSKRFRLLFSFVFVKEYIYIYMPFVWSHLIQQTSP